MRILQRIESSDGATKYLFETEDGSRIESVFLVMNHDNKDSICISSQVGCTLSCTFCSTGLIGYKRNLSGEEIASQVDEAFSDLSFEPGRRFDVSFMGEGEPLMNLDGVLEAKRILREKRPSFNFYLSTVGIAPQIEKLADVDPDFGLQISLHAPNDQLRTRIMAINRKYNIERVLRAGEAYAAVASRPVTLNYCMMRGINDGLDLAEELADLLSGRPFRVQLVNFNPHISIGYSPTTEQCIQEFLSVLQQRGISAHYGKQLGKMEGAGCGQLDADYEKGALKRGGRKNLPLQTASNLVDGVLE